MKRLTPGRINSLGLAISSIINFFALIVWTHILSPFEFGIYALVSATVLFINATIFEWIRLSASRLLFDATDPLEINSAMANASAALVLGLWLTLLPIVLILRVSDISFFGASAEWWLPVWAWLGSEVLFAMSTVAARLRLLSWRFFILMSLRSVFSLVIGIFFIKALEAGALGVVSGIIAAQYLSALVVNYKDKVWRRLQPLHVYRKDLRQLLTYGLPLILSSGLNYACAISDRYIIVGILGASEVGRYSVSVDLVQKTVIFLMLAVNLSAYPATVRAFEAEGRDSGERRLSESFIIYLMIGAPAASAMAVLSPGIARIFVGPEFQEAVAVLMPWVALAAILRALSTFHLSVALQMVKRTRLLILSPAVTLTILVPAGIIGVHLAGLTGMAVGALLAQSFSFVIFFCVTRRHVEVRLVSPASLAVVGLSLAIGAALLPARSHVDPIVTLAALLAVGILYSIIIWRSYDWLIRHSRSKKSVT